jgi:hypothetical protein
LGNATRRRVRDHEEEASAPSATAIIAGQETVVQIHKVREGDVFEYVLKLWIEGNHGQPVPEELKPKIDKAFDELLGRVDTISTGYEVGGSMPGFGEHRRGGVS